MLGTIGIPVAAEDIRHFELRSLHGERRSEVLGWPSRFRRGQWARQQVQGAAGGADLGGGQAQVARRGREAAMAEQQLDGSQVRAVLKKVAGEGVPQAVGRHRLGEATALASQLAGVTDPIARDVGTGNHAWKPPLGGPGEAVPIAQDPQEPLGEHDVAVLLALALGHPDGHALAIDVGGLERDGLRDAKSGGVTDREYSAGFAPGNAAQEVPHLLGAEDHRQGLRLLRYRQDFLHIPGPLHCHGVEEAQRGSVDLDRAWGEPFLSFVR